MSNKNKKLNESFAEEKARVRLYKSGKNWVKAGIREIQRFCCKVEFIV
ncbi:KxYKxGKxW signal peptide domain-containing protein [Staphylococcus epidermidis]|nr:KxYKxGKxW signal peptide domain-containing protein [Staphylococcus epidermidis]MCW7914319.1 KxYKxGKxW signal peptide domain-containing protein [Staphylococcus epidermidis]MCW7918909.1 KxYKxGKxW signal peptide domain-containing protein [Staphylococcus epidermidis]MCW7921257.1 KxYKxGKxW signal peptide domain-containing protein [Staphylococcus epidermidis]MCW7923611.1 KxYKxGKxW signal peptide domain-containing protein [Staphylococcus epidermidis]MCW7925973.1 KxYKxGKxW signal peptide domain-con